MVKVSSLNHYYVIMHLQKMGQLGLPLNGLSGDIILNLLYIQKVPHISHAQNGTVISLPILHFHSLFIHTHTRQRCISLLIHNVHIHISFIYQSEGHSIPIKAHTSCPYHMYNSVQVQCRNNQLNLSRYTRNATRDITQSIMITYSQLGKFIISSHIFTYTT